MDFAGLLSAVVGTGLGLFDGAKLSIGDGDGLKEIEGSNDG